MIFRNRSQAGELLAQKLEKYKSKDCVILALPRGGVPVAAEVAKALKAPLDVLVVKKIGAPFSSELALGALCEGGAPVFNTGMIARVGLSPDDLGPAVHAAAKEIRRQIDLYRGGRELTSIFDKTAIIVDDGLATGATILAAVKCVKRMKPQKIIVAVPVAAADSARSLRAKVDLITYEELEDFMSVGQWYMDFSQVSDAEVLALLDSYGRKKIRIKSSSQTLSIQLQDVSLEGELTTFPGMKALIIFAHGSGSSRKSPRNVKVAKTLNAAGFGTLLFDLLTEGEFAERKNVFDTEFLGERLFGVHRWLKSQAVLAGLPMGFFGASTGAAAALRAAAQLLPQEQIYAIVTRSGRPDLAGDVLKSVKVPTLLLVGSLDSSVVDVNQQALQNLAHAEIALIQGATHLFEEPGTLEEVSRLAVEWFTRYLPVKKVTVDQLRELEGALEQNYRPLKREIDLDPLLNLLKDKRVVLLGESTHGTREFYQLRSLISQRLIHEHGFKFIAVEGDWPDFHRLNKYIQKGEGRSAQQVLAQNHRWPTWMWANEETASLAEWMKKHGGGIYGLDIYSMFESIDGVVTYLESVSPGLAHEIKKRYACFEPFEEDEISYARSLLREPLGCEEEVLMNLQQILQLRLQFLAKDDEDFFSSQQNARIAANAEAYYRATLKGDASSWNIRDQHMMETLDLLLKKSGEGAKAIVWAHNTHIGDYRATDMEAGGYINLGGLVRQNYGEDNVALVGLSTYQGEVTAGTAWDSKEEEMPLSPAREESYEFYMHQIAKKHRLSQFYFALGSEAAKPFFQRRGQRAIGVVYDSRHERRSNYVPTVLAKRYDLFIFIDRTRALRSLRNVFVRGEFPETWPSGQ